jgi:hypothetical protein
VRLVCPRSASFVQAIGRCLHTRLDQPLEQICRVFLGDCHNSGASGPSGASSTPFSATKSSTVCAEMSDRASTQPFRVVWPVWPVCSVLLLVSETMRAGCLRSMPAAVNHAVAIALAPPQQQRPIGLHIPPVARIRCRRSTALGPLHDGISSSLLNQSTMAMTASTGLAVLNECHRPSPAYP